MATAFETPTASQSTSAPLTDGHVPKKDAAERRVQYVLNDRVTKTKWFVVFTESNGKEEFVSQECGSCNQEVCWHSHPPSPREHLAARELMAQGKARSGWKTTLTFEDEVLTTITTLGAFPECVNAAKHEFRSLLVDPCKLDHVSFAVEIQQHLHSLDGITTQVYELFERHRRFRARAHELGMIRD